MEGKKAPEYIVRRRPGKKALEEAKRTEVQSETKLRNDFFQEKGRKLPFFTPRPTYPIVHQCPAPQLLSEYLSLLSTRDWTGPTGNFRVISYDVLSDFRIHLNPDKFQSASQTDLAFPTRCQKITAELLSLQGQVVCLQGVEHYQAAYFTAFPYFEALQSMTSESQTSDGVAILYDSRAFQLTFSAKVAFQAKGHSSLFSENSALIAVLSHKRTQKSVLVATVRLSHDDQFGQLAQLLVLTKAISETLSRERGDTPVILAGNFDCNPSSLLYELLSQGRVLTSSLDINRVSNWQHCDTAVLGIDPSIYEAAFGAREPDRPQAPPTTVQLSHLSETGVTHLTESGSRYVVSKQFANGVPTAFSTQIPTLASAYKAILGSEAFPTMYSGTVLGATDYIWYGQGLRPTSVWRPLRVESVVRYESAPNQHWPSDHIAVGCDFRWEK